MNIEPLKAALAKATPGDWFPVPYGDGDSLVICEDEAGNHRIAFMATPGSRDSASRNRTWRVIKNNAALICLFRNHAAELIAAVEERERLREALRAITNAVRLGGVNDALAWRCLEKACQTTARAALEGDKP